MKKFTNYLNLMIGLFLAAFSFNLFLAPYNLAAGGISGLSIIFHKIFNINESIFILIMNLFLLAVSLIFLGFKKTKNTFFGSILFPIFIYLTKYITSLIKISDIELIVIAVFGGILSGYGYGLIFKSGFTSGGTDILNQIMEKYLFIPISKSIIMIDGLITILSGFVFGFTTMIYALVTLVLISLFNNKTMVGTRKNKTLYIYSTKYKEIKNYLHNEFKLDSTDFDCIGGYSKKKGKVILTVVRARDYYRIKEDINLIDKNAFIITTDAYQLINANVAIRNK